MTQSIEARLAAIEAVLGKLVQVLDTQEIITVGQAAQTRELLGLNRRSTDIEAQRFSEQGTVKSRVDAGRNGIQPTSAD